MVILLPKFDVNCFTYKWFCYEVNPVCVLNYTINHSNIEESTKTPPEVLLLSFMLSNNSM